jgi:ABC-2 type transport system ATP-binding protein
MSTIQPVLHAQRVSADYGSRPVLSDFEITVQEREIYVLLGGNGAGKSTALAVFLGFVRPQKGSARVCGVDVAQDPHGARRRLAYVAENVALYEHLSAFENLEYLLALSGIRLDRRALNTLLDSVGLSEAARAERTASYSKGMRQRVAIALALARDVPALLLDEPTSGLDPQAVSDFARLLTSVRARGKSVLMVTHDLVGAAEVADRVGILRQGRLLEELIAPAGGKLNVEAVIAAYSRGAHA